MPNSYPDRRLSKLRCGPMCLLLVFISACLLSERPTAQKVTFEPVDNAYREPALLASRAAILEAVLWGDVARLEGWLTDDFGGGPVGRAHYIEVFMTDPEALRELGKALALGGDFRQGERGREFCAPYVYASYPRTLPAYFNTEAWPWAVILPSAEVRRQPSEQSSLLGVLGFELVHVEMGELSPGATWVKVRIPAGSGYMRSRDVRDPNDFVACLVPDDSGVWKLARFEENQF
jgi:hypothetical protein